MNPLPGWFSSFTTSAFRIEALDQYVIADEQSRFTAFVENRAMPDRNLNNDEWLQLVHAATRAGKTMSRVHVVNQPLSDYVRYELVSYAANVEAGEQINLADRSLYGGGLAKFSRDFWMFDDEHVGLMSYDDEGHFLGAVDDSVNIDIYRTLRDEALAGAVDYATFMERNTVAG